MSPKGTHPEKYPKQELATNKPHTYSSQKLEEDKGIVLKYFPHCRKRREKQNKGKRPSPDDRRNSRIQSGNAVTKNQKWQERKT